HQVVKSTLPIFAKTVVVSNNKYLGLDFFHQHLLDKFLRTELGKLLGKGDSDQVIDTKSPEKCGLLLERSQQFYFMFAWIKDQSGVGPKRNQNGFSLSVIGNFSNAGQDLLVAQMNAVEGTQGDHRVLNR